MKLFELFELIGADTNIKVAQFDFFSYKKEPVVLFRGKHSHAKYDDFCNKLSHNMKNPEVLQLAPEFTGNNIHFLELWIDILIAYDPELEQIIESE